MQSGLISDINRYISYLNTKGLSISVHGKMISGLIEHNQHKNAYCSFIKTDSEAWQCCVNCQKKVFNIYNGDCLFGMCHAGVEEYVFFVDAKTFVSVSGYGIDQEKAADRLHRLSHKFCFDFSELSTLYEKALKHEKENFEELKVCIKPLCHMLLLLQLSIGNGSNTETKNKTFDSILAFVNSNALQDISLRSIADACNCSESTVSHLFKEYKKQSVRKYINDLRIKQAENFLLYSDIPVGNIALLCGFTNTNYFATAFKKEYGVSPTQYRAQNKTLALLE